MLKNLVIYASETGNTKMLAEEVYNAIPSSMGEKAIVDVHQWNGTLDAENYFIGFWANRGSCSLEILDILSSLHRRNISLFGTCGMGNSKQYYDSLEQNARVWIADDNNFIGSYFCLGKMPYEIRDKYESCRGKYDDAKIDQMIVFFNQALTHPNRTDLQNARVFVDRSLKKIDSLIGAYV
jgi:flavodoxin